MEKIPEWAKRWLPDNSAQVSHGLNLALPLEHPERLPQLLLDIAVSEKVAQQALESLSFVHFARFVPSWDGRALMVTTEFDGPLEPYVMDFVIALGDVFDLLLSYCKPRPPLPVREYPDEFWAFVQYWNRVPVFPRDRGRDELLFPANEELPLYSAYPAKTAIDIAGPHATLPPPALDHPAARIDLHDVQANILRGYNAAEAEYLFYTVTDAAAARRWLAGLDVASAAPWAGGAPHVLTNVGLTHAGMAVLLPQRGDDLQRFPQAFREGSAARGALNGDTGPSKPEGWLFGRAEQDIHVVLVVWAKAGWPDGAVPPGLLAPAGMRQVYRHAAKALEHGHEYFGYRDGLSGPRIAGMRPQDKLAKRDFQPAASPGEFLLGRDYASVYGGSSLGDLPADLASNGTFGALRLFEQDVDGFHATVATESQRLGLDPELFKAKLLGRWPEGQPLSLAPEYAKQAGVTNGFDYAPSWEHPHVHEDFDGLRCPAGAHIRRSNPRSARVIGQPHSRRLIRRGMPSAWPEVDGQGASVNKRGFMGLFIGASIERQFEFIQQQWLQGSVAASGIRGTQDAIAGLREGPTDFHIPTQHSTCPHLRQPPLTASIPPLVKTRGGVYLFFPGLKMLKCLAAEAAPAPREAEPSRESSVFEVRARAGLALPRLLQGIANFVLWVFSILPASWRSALTRWLLRKADSADLGPPQRAQFEPQDETLKVSVDTLAPAFINRPYPLYAGWRAAGREIVWVKEFQAYWVLTRKACTELLQNHEGFMQAAPGTPRGILTMDPPRHTVMREVLNDVFNKALARAPALTDELAAEALAKLEAGDGKARLEQFDFMSAYGWTVPRHVIWRLFGLRRPVDIEACDALAQMQMTHYGKPELPFMVGGLRLMAFMFMELGKAWVQSHFGGRHYEGTMIGGVAQATALFSPGGKRQLKFSESLATLQQIVLASMSAHFLLGTSTLNLLRDDRHPWRTLAQLRREDKPAFDAKLKLALDEARRVEPPVTIIDRYSTREQEFCGVKLPAGAPVFALIGSANRDAGIGGGDPEQFIYDREPGAGNLSLGHGIHECVGKALQGIIVPRALERMIEAMPDLQLVDKHAVPAWFDNVYFRVLQALPVQRGNPSSHGNDQ